MLVGRQTPHYRGFSGSRRHPGHLASIDPAPVNQKEAYPPDHLIWATRIGLVAKTLSTQIDGSGEVQLSHNARRSIVLQVSPYAG